MKRPFLVAHDYGQGGLWAYIWAQSREAIEDRYKVRVVDTLPRWLGEDQASLESFDIDDVPDWMPPRP